MRKLICWLLGHRYGDWVVDKNTLNYSEVCRRCGDEEFHTCNDGHLFSAWSTPVDAKAVVVKSGKETTTQVQRRHCDVCNIVDVRTVW